MALKSMSGFKSFRKFLQAHPALAGMNGTDFFGQEELKDLQQMVDDTLVALKKKRYLTCTNGPVQAAAEIMIKAAGSKDQASQVMVEWGLHQPQAGLAVAGGNAQINPGTHQHFTVSFAGTTWHLYLADAKGKRRNVVGMSAVVAGVIEFVNVENA